MLQIKKKCIIDFSKYNLEFLLLNKKLANVYQVKKKTSKLIILRSPKHFNIGKQKILNLCYRTPTLLVELNYKTTTNVLVKHPDLLFQIIIKKLQLNSTVTTKSVKIRIKTKFKLKWLET